MRQPPHLDAAQARMAPGRITRDGFLGSDRRALIEIIEQDRNAVARLGLTNQQIADRLDYLTEHGKAGLGTWVLVEGDLEVRVESVRGGLPCPWGHKGLYPKMNVFLRNLTTGEELVWTGMQIHLVREHGFYEGKGSPFRLDPERVARALGL